MKKILFTLLCAAFVFQSCSKEEEVRQPQEVEFSIDYSFSSGNMSRTTNDEIYTKFFNDHIKTRKITPKSYSLTFVNSETTQKTEITGTWANKGLIRLLEGKYAVSGTSLNNGLTTYVRDSLALKFEDTIEISSKTTSINIKAGYNCSLVFFDAANIKNVRYYAYNSGYSSVNEDLRLLDNYYYGFVKSYSSYEISYLEVTRKDGKLIKVHTKGLNLESGKYYFFNDMTGGFDLEPMTPGN